jgi:hypothetical protein
MASRTASKQPQTIGEYEVLGKIAGGGSGCVYKGRHRATGELVAVKLASKETAGNSLLRKRFEQEFHVASSLGHPHLVRALHLGEEGGTPYIVLEFVDGPSLGDRIERDGALPEDEAVRIITQVAGALEAAHRQRIIHRDVKPDNILLTPQGTAKLTDLGLAKDVEGGGGLTRTAAGLGTPNFMAPEQFRDAKNADARCDVYSLGATLYMAVTGQLPFEARVVYEVWQKKINNDVAPARQLVPDLSAGLERVISRAMEVNPQQRHVSCLDLINDLKRVERQRARAGAAPASPAAAGLLPDSAAPAANGKRRKADQRATVRFSSNQGGFCNAVGGAKKQHWPAKVQDVSAGGIALLLGRRFEPKTTLWVSVLGPGKAADRYFLVRVVRVQARPGKKWLVGCVFARQLSEDEVETLR